MGNPVKQKEALGTLFAVATPIGNLEDITYRAVRTLSQVDALACEDTRYTRRIFERYRISKPGKVFSYHEHNEERAGTRIVGLLRDGRSVALCTDSGFPGISDPGYRIISKCLDAGIPVEVIPGGGAVSAALLNSGLPTSSYTFKGFPPRKPGPQIRFLEMEQDMPHTMVLFESPHRVGKLLKNAFDVLGNRKAAVCIEMTKKFEEIHRGFLEELSDRFRDTKVRGEVTVVIAGKHLKFIKQDKPDVS